MSKYTFILDRPQQKGVDYRVSFPDTRTIVRAKASLPPSDTIFVRYNGDKPDTVQLKDIVSIYNWVDNLVYGYKLKDERGFYKQEIDEIKEMLPEGDKASYNDALNNITCIGDEEGNTLYFHTDIKTALICYLEERGIKNSEWD